MTTKKMIMIMILLSSTYLSSSRSALLLFGKTTLMVSILIKQKLLISAVLDALEYQISQEKRLLEPTLSLYIAGMLCSHQCDTTP